MVIGHNTGISVHLPKNIETVVPKYCATKEGNQQAAVLTK